MSPEWVEDKRYFEEKVRKLEETQEKHSTALQDIKILVMQAKMAVIVVASVISLVWGLASAVVSNIMQDKSVQVQVKEK
jgi:type III secretory pathway component EscS